MPDNLQVSVYEFIAEWTGLDRNNIVKGWQAAGILPAGVEEYAVFTAISETRRGTNVEEYSPENNSVTIIKSNMVDYQIDIVSESSELARKRAAVLETIARSPQGVDFFKQYGVSLLYADDVKAIETVSMGDNYVNRYMLTLHLEVPDTVELSQEYFDKAEVKPILANRKI